jgi:serine/threonine protein kinase
MNIQQSVWREEVNAAKIKAEFRVEHVLGNGAFATVFKASYLHENHNLPNNSNAVALKIINLKRVANRRRNRRSKGSITVCSVHSISKELETDELFISSRKGKRVGHDRKKNGALLLSVKEMVAREISVHREASKARHPNIVALLDSFYYDLPRSTNVAALVMELCPEDLGSYLRRKKNERKHEAQAWKLLPESEVRHALRHVLRGLAFLHSIGIAHRKCKV